MINYWINFYCANIKRFIPQSFTARVPGKVGIGLSRSGLRREEISSQSGRLGRIWGREGKFRPRFAKRM